MSFYNKNIKKLIKSINENFDDDSPYIDPEEPLFHYSPAKSKEDNATDHSGLEEFKGTDREQCEERLYVNNGKILVTAFSRGKNHLKFQLKNMIS